MTLLKATATDRNISQQKQNPQSTLVACELQLMRKCTTAAPGKCSWRLQLI
jgi:hypothetical protein